jgi:hypothetical protein
MPVIQNTALSSPVHEFLVAFSVTRPDSAAACRRTVIVLAESPSDAKRICKHRYPRGLHLQVFPKETVVA